jgi:hypothetical protein
VAILPAEVLDHDVRAAVCTAANLPPPVPHRILHCSWII